LKDKYRADEEKSRADKEKSRADKEKARLMFDKLYSSVMDMTFDKHVVLEAADGVELRVPEWVKEQSDFIKTALNGTTFSLG
jgi:hypothetical protein